MDSDLSRPWWRALSQTVNGWWNLGLALYCTAAVAGGAIYGEVILFSPSRKAETIHWIASTQASFYWSLMLLYGVVGLYCGRKFVRWLIRFSRR